jgi:hypothetical protein
MERMQNEIAAGTFDKFCEKYLPVLDARAE